MNIHVLIVEDNKDCAESMRLFLRMRTDAKYEVEVVETLAAGVERLAAGGIDAVLLDLSLPDGRDLDVVGQIAAAGKDVAIIVVTGWDSPRVAQLAKMSGADEVLVKPADPVEVSKKLQYLVIHRRAEADRHAIEAALSEMGSIIMRLGELAEKKPTISQK